MKYQIVFLFLFFCLSNYAQEKLNFIDYDSVYEKATKSSGEGNFEKAIEHLDKISKNDSTYCSVLVSKSYFLVNLKKYDEAIALVDQGLESNCDDIHADFYVNKSVALLNQGKHKDATDTCNEGLGRFPQNKTLLYNKAVALEGLDKIEEAAALYQRVIILDPFYRKPYLNLGNIYYKQELLSQALMCFNMYLLIEPDADNAFSVLKSLNNIVKSKNENSKKPDIKLSIDDDSFEEIDLILNNKIALNAKYDTGNEIDIALTRQNHALLHSLKDFSGNGGFWDNKFVTYYKWVQKNDFFNVLSYTLAYSIENEDYKKIVSKKEDEIVEFFDLSKQKWLEIVTNNNSEKKDLTYFYEDGYTKGIGKMKGDNFIGLWDLYNEKGRLMGKGGFNSNGARDGDWVWYNARNKKKETAQYVNGKLNGANNYYFENGRQKVISNYKNDNLDGEYDVYNENGALRQKRFFKDGKLDGPYTSYHSIGEKLVESRAVYNNGNVKGSYQEFSPMGTLSAEIHFEDGKANGKEIRYYLNGELSLDLLSKNGLVDGYYKKFYPNGQTKEVGLTSEGNYVGDWQTFYSTSTLESDYKFNQKGEIDGEYRFYDVDGKLHYIFEYRNDEFIAYKYFDKDGNVLSENRKKGGEFYFTGLSPEGKVLTEGLYDIKGGKKGVWKYYTRYGHLKDEGLYDENKLHGVYKTYYPHGQLESMSDYKNDTLQGYYAFYHKNGKLRKQGWYKDNNLHGELFSYNLGGTITEINFYHRGQLHGEQLLFSGNGIKTQRSIYYYGRQMKDIYYDANGNVSCVIDYDNDEKEYELVFKNYNNKPSTTLVYVNGVKHGVYSYFDFYGRKVTEGQYLNGKLHDKMIWYHENGNLETEVNYVYGELDGAYIDYYEDGTIESKHHYSLGKLHGEGITYYKDGTIKSKDEYHYNERFGRRENYCSSGNLQLVRFYEHGRLIGYSYLDENSEEIPMIPIEDETSKIVSYYNNGKISRELEYKDGYLHHVYKEYFFSGQLKEEKYYDNRELEGNMTEYFPNGNIKKEQQYISGNINGIAKEYFDNGNLKKEETYLYDIKEGITRKYNETGKLILEETYFDGNIFTSISK